MSLSGGRSGEDDMTSGELPIALRGREGEDMNMLGEDIAPRILGRVRKAHLKPFERSRIGRILYRATRPIFRCGRARLSWWLTASKWSLKRWILRAGKMRPSTTRLA